MARIVDDSLDDDVTNLGAELYPNAGQCVLAMCLINEGNSFSGCQGVSNSSHYILIERIPASHATSLQTLNISSLMQFQKKCSF